METTLKTFNESISCYDPCLSYKKSYLTVTTETNWDDQEKFEDAVRLVEILLSNLFHVQLFKFVSEYIMEYASIDEDNQTLSFDLEACEKYCHDELDKLDVEDLIV